jgi:hypothetical protein
VVADREIDGAWSLIGGRLGFGGLEMDGGGRFLECVAGIAGQQRGGGGGHGGAGASSPAPTRCVTGRKTERNRDGEKGLTGGPHM